MDFASTPSDRLIITTGLPCLPGTAPVSEPFSIITGGRIDYSKPPPNASDPPAIVRGDYAHDHEILQCHEAIRALFGFMLYQAPILRKRAEQKMSSLRTGHTIQRAALQREIDVLVDKETRLMDGSMWDAYVERAKPILDEYLPIASSEAIGCVIVSPSQVEHERPDIIHRRLALIRRYYIVAKDYLKIEVSFENDAVMACEECETEYSQMELNSERSFLICPCGYEFPIPSGAVSCSDYEHVDTISRSVYDPTSTFIKRMQIYQGIGGGDIPSHLYIQLNGWLGERGLITSERAASIPINRWNEKDGTSISLLEAALRGTRNAAYYTHMDIIGHYLWGWKLADLRPYWDRMLRNYAVTQAVCRRIRPSDHKSTININLLLFWYLKSVDYPCRYEGFRIPITRASLELYSRMFEFACKETGVPFTPIL